MHLKSFVVVSPVLLAALLSFACTGTPKRSAIVKEWDAALADMEVRSLWPPRQNFRIGDIYLPAARPRDWVSSISLDHKIKEFASTRRIDQRTVEASATEMNLGAGQFVFFPEFSSIAVRGADLDWLLPNEVLSLSDGESWGNNYRIKLHFTSARSVALPYVEILDEMIDTLPGGGHSLIHVLKKELPLSEMLLSLSHPNLSSDVIDLDVVTEVYYALALDITITKRSSSMQRRGSYESLSMDNENLVSRLNRRLSALNASALGADVVVTSASDTSIGLRRALQEPIAIGYRSMGLKLDRKTGQVLSFGRSKWKEGAYVEKGDIAEVRAIESAKEESSIPIVLAMALKNFFGSASVTKVEANYSNDGWKILTKRPLQASTTPLVVARAERKRIVQDIREGYDELTSREILMLLDFENGKLLFVQPVEPAF